MPFKPGVVHRPRPVPVHRRRARRPRRGHRAGTAGPGTATCPWGDAHLSTAVLSTAASTCSYSAWSRTSRASAPGSTARSSGPPRARRRPRHDREPVLCWPPPSSTAVGASSLPTSVADPILLGAVVLGNGVNLLVLAFIWQRGRRTLLYPAHHPQPRHRPAAPGHRPDRDHHHPRHHRLPARHGLPQPPGHRLRRDQRRHRGPAGRPARRVPRPARRTPRRYREARAEEGGADAEQRARYLRRARRRLRRRVCGERAYQARRQRRLRTCGTTSSAPTPRTTGKAANWAPPTPQDAPTCPGPRRRTLQRPSRRPAANPTAAPARTPATCRLTSSDDPGGRYIRRKEPGGTRSVLLPVLLPLRHGPEDAHRTSAAPRFQRFISLAVLGAYWPSPWRLAVSRRPPRPPQRAPRRLRAAGRHHPGRRPAGGLMLTVSSAVTLLVLVYSLGQGMADRDDRRRWRSSTPPTSSSWRGSPAPSSSPETSPSTSTSASRSCSSRALCWCCSPSAALPARIPRRITHVDHLAVLLRALPDRHRHDLRGRGHRLTSPARRAAGQEDRLGAHSCWRRCC